MNSESTDEGIGCGLSGHVILMRTTGWMFRFEGDGTQEMENTGFHPLRIGMVRNTDG